MSLSVVINTKNASETLSNAIQSVSFADEIIVVDMMSTDSTVEVAKKLGAKVYTYKIDHGYADPARNFALSKATQDWTLVLDADEEIPDTLATEIQKIIAEQDSKILCYRLPRKNIIWGEWIQHTGWWPDYQVRLFKSGTVSWEVGVHRVPTAPEEIQELPAKEKLAILHHNYPTISSFIQRLDRYSTISAKEQPKSKFDVRDFSNSFWHEFLRRFFEFEGYKDGTRGLSLSLLQASYQLSHSLKQWENAGLSNVDASESQLLEAVDNWRADLAYWVAHWQVSHSTGFAKLYWKIRRTLKV